MSQSQEGSIALYHERSSSCSWRVRIGLAWKGIEYESRLLEWDSGELQSEAYRRRCFRMQRWSARRCASWWRR